MNHNLGLPGAMKKANMSKNLKSPMSDDVDNKLSYERSLNSGLSSDALARRRMLLKSLGKGATVATAVSVPMHSLAAIGTLSVTANGKRCTMSGTMSGVHSKETVKEVCQGFVPTKYQTIANWPGTHNTVAGVTHVSNTVNGITFTDESTIQSLFSSYGNKKLLQKLQDAPSSDQAVWITALLNSLNPSALNYPYSPKQVLDLYNDTNTRAAALDFFRGYMQTGT